MQRFQVRGAAVTDRISGEASGPIRPAVPGGSKVLTHVQAVSLCRRTRFQQAWVCSFFAGHLKPQG